MSGVYKESFRSGQRPKRSRGYSLWLTACDLFVYVAMAVLLPITLVCIITPYVEPATLGWLSVLVLGAPLVFLADVIVLLYWLIRWKLRHALLYGIVVVILALFVPRYYNLDPHTESKEKINERRFIKVMSYNVANSNKVALIDSIDKVSPDVICLQEYLSFNDDAWNRLLSRYKPTNPNLKDFSCEILSRHKILRHGIVDSMTQYATAWADILLNQDTIRFINLHLQSTSIKEHDSQFITEHGFISDSARHSKLHSIVTRLRDNNIKRSEQVARVRRFIDSSPVGKIILCGDFNDVPLSYTYSMLIDGLNDTFRETGHGYSYTFSDFFKLMRIDYIFCSEQLEPTTYEVRHDWSHSDHYPVIVRFKKTNTKK